MEIKSNKIENVDCTIGRNTKRPSSVTMAVSDESILEIITLFKKIKKGETPETGLVKLELVAHYAEDEETSDEAEQARDELLDSINANLDDNVKEKESEK